VTNKYCYLYLTCEDQAEADKISTALLEKRLIACAKFIPIDCKYWWQGKITDAKEIMLIMESHEDLFDAIETEVKKLHSYETFVLEAIPVTKLSKKATKWMEQELKND
jgi:periplasmic divalent cation tolerance protein